MGDRRGKQTRSGPWGQVTVRLSQEPSSRGSVRHLPPFIGAVYERNTPLINVLTFEVIGPPPRVTILKNDVTYFGCPGLLVLMPWPLASKAPPKWRTTDEVRFNLEEFLGQYHPINNVVPIRRAI